MGHVRGESGAESWHGRPLCAAHSKEKEVEGEGESGMEVGGVAVVPLQSVSMECGCVWV